MPSKFMSASPTSNHQNQQKPPIYKRKWFIAIIALLLIGMIGSCGSSNSSDSDSSSGQTASTQNDIELKATTEYLEYSNKDVDPTTLVNASDSKATVATKDKIDLTKVGGQTITYEVTLDNQTSDYAITFTVRDTKAPSISLSNTELSFEQGGTCNPREAISSVSDEVDGELPYVETAPESKGTQIGIEQFYDQGWYTIEGGVDSSNPGTYTLTVKAVDKHGNVRTKELNVTVIEQTKEEATPAPAPAASTETKTYIANTNTHKFHKPSCGSVKKMKDSNKAEITATREEMIAMGYDPCQKCNP